MSDRPLTPSELANRAREVAKKLRLGARRFGAIHTIVIEPEPFARLYEELADEVDRLTEENARLRADRSDVPRAHDHRGLRGSGDDGSGEPSLRVETSELVSGQEEPRRQLAPSSTVNESLAPDQFISVHVTESSIDGDLLTEALNWRCRDSCEGAEDLLAALVSLIGEERAEVARLTEELKNARPYEYVGQPLEHDFYRSPNAGELVYRWADERRVLIASSERDEERARADRLTKERNRAWSVRDRLDQQFSEQLAEERAGRENAEQERDRAWSVRARLDRQFSEQVDRLTEALRNILPHITHRTHFEDNPRIPGIPHKVCDNDCPHHIIDEVLGRGNQG